MKIPLQKFYLPVSQRDRPVSNIQAQVLQCLIDTMVDENTPPAATNTLLCPATPTRSGKTAPLSVNSSQISTPRHRKTAGLTRQTEVSTSDVTRKQWPRIGKRIPSEDIKAAIQQILAVTHCQRWAVNVGRPLVGRL